MILSAGTTVRAQLDLKDNTVKQVVYLYFGFSQIDKIGNNANIGIRGP